VPLTNEQLHSGGPGEGPLCGRQDENPRRAQPWTGARGRFISSTMKDAGRELGPSYNSLVSKASGARIETVDHTDRDTLIAKYTS
jgi:hypothetical protein